MNKLNQEARYSFIGNFSAELLASEFQVGFIFSKQIIASVQTGKETTRNHVMHPNPLLEFPHPMITSAEVPIRDVGESQTLCETSKQHPSPIDRLVFFHESFVFQ